MMRALALMFVLPTAAMASEVCDDFEGMFIDNAPAIYAKNGGTTEMAQAWVKSPARLWVMVQSYNTMAMRVRQKTATREDGAMLIATRGLISCWQGEYDASDPVQKTAWDNFLAGQPQSQQSADMARAQALLK